MSFNRTGRWRRFAAAFAALAVGAATAIAVAPSATAADSGRTTSVSVTSAPADGLQVSVSGTGYTNLPSPVGGPTGPGVYASIVTADATADDINNQLATKVVKTSFVYFNPGTVASGAWSTAITADAAKLDDGAAYDVVVWVAHGLVTPDTLLYREPLVVTADQWSAVFPKVWKPQVQVFLNGSTTPVTAGTAVYDGDVLTVEGSGFDPTANVGGRGVPIPANLPQGDYVVFGSFSPVWQPSAGVASSARKVGPQKWALAESVLNQVPNDKGFQDTVRAQWAELKADGTFIVDLTVANVTGGPADGTYGVFTYGAGGVNNAAQEKELRLDYQGQRTTTTPTTTTPTTPAQRSTSASVVSATSTGFSIRVTGTGYSATDLPNGVYAALYDASKGGPEQMNAGQSGIAMDWIQNVGSGSWSTTLSGSASALSSTGNYYIAVWPGHSNVSGGNIIANIPVNLSGAAGNTGDGTQGGASGTATAAVTTVDLAKDRTQTVTASGFTPGETVHGELHSVVVDLGTQTADKDGKVTFTFQIPVGFEVGKHAVVLLGAKSGHSVTAPFTVIDSAKAPATTTGSKPATSGSNASTSVTVLGESAQCTEETVPGTAATPRLNWGVKSSFISYIQSGVANGTITPASGAAKAGDSFTWGTGAGTLNAQGNGTLTFPGSLHITAHGGVLDLSISNLKVTAKGKTGTLTATIKSQDMQGNPVPVGSVVLADLTFPSLSATGGKATATLTAAGAAAFAGFYQAGEQLDPITVSFAGGSDATTRTVCRDANGNIVSGDGAAAAPGLASTGVPVGQQLAFALLLLLAGAGAVVLASRRRESRVSRHL